MKKILILLLVALLGCEKHNDVKKSKIDSSSINQELEKKALEDGVMNEKDLKILLVGSGYRKAQAVLGYYDDSGWSGSNKLSCVIYKDKVRDSDGVIKNVALNLVWQEFANWDTAIIKEVIVVPEGGTFRCGLTPWTIKNGKILNK